MSWLIIIAIEIIWTNERGKLIKNKKVAKVSNLTREYMLLLWKQMTLVSTSPPYTSISLYKMIWKENWSHIWKFQINKSVFAFIIKKIYVIVNRKFKTNLNIKVSLLWSKINLFLVTLINLWCMTNTRPTTLLNSR